MLGNLAILGPFRIFDLFWDDQGEVGGGEEEDGAMRRRRGEGIIGRKSVQCTFTDLPAGDKTP